MLRTLEIGPFFLTGGIPVSASEKRATSNFLAGGWVKVWHARGRTSSDENTHFRSQNRNDIFPGNPKGTMRCNLRVLIFEKFDEFRDDLIGGFFHQPVS